MKRIIMVIFIMSYFSSFMNGQNAIPNSFKEFKLGMTFQQFAKMELLYKETKYIQNEFDIVRYKYMKLYRIENQKTSSGNDVIITLGFYDENLALIVVGYESSSKSEILNGLIGKYGKQTNQKRQSYFNPLGGNSITIDQYYWGNHKTYILGYYYNNTSLLSQLFFANRANQIIIQERIMKEAKSKIE